MCRFPYLTGDSEADGLNKVARHLVGSGNLTVTHIQTTLWHECKTALRLGRELGQGEQLVVLILIVTDVAVTIQRVNEMGYGI
jgi:hypothetical protein